MSVHRYEGIQPIESAPRSRPRFYNGLLKLVTGFTAAARLILTRPFTTWLSNLL